MEMIKYLSFFLLPAFGLACSQPGAIAQNKLSPDAFESMLAKDSSVQLVDVRTPEEYAAGHLEKALLINYYDSNFADQIGKLDKNRPVMVYCAAGSRSSSAAKKLFQMGFKKVYDLAGGMGAWRAKGKKTVQ